jgi:carboxyl-terminal processing protease
MSVKILLNGLLILCASFSFLSCEELLLGSEPENNPAANFETLWKTFDENYALFSVKEVNWDSLHDVYGSLITSSTSADELWDIMTSMLYNLNDGHVKLFNEDFSKIFNSSVLSRRNADDFSLTLTKKFLEAPGVAGEGIITFGKIKNHNIGYIHIASFVSKSADAGWAYDIDPVLKELSNSEAIIIDLRNNGGGLRVTGDIIVSRFIDREITYFFQRTKTGRGHNDLSNLIPVSVSPAKDNPRYLKKNVLLTNRFSASGSEYFTQVFSFLNYSTHIGDTTFGAFGDIISTAELPNGWMFTYPCRLTTTPGGECLEDKGIIPDILVENTVSDIRSGNDKVLNFAVQYLTPGKK